MRIAFIVFLSLFTVNINPCLAAAPYFAHHFFQEDSLPQVSISSDDANPTDKLPLSATITFDQAVYGFEKEDITINNGFVHTFKSLVTHSATLGPDLPYMSDFLELPADVEIDANDNIYVVDEELHRVRVFDQNHIYIKSLGSGSPGDGEYEFDTPKAIALDVNGALYVLDAENYRVQIYNSNLEYINTLTLGDPDDFNQFYELRDIAVSKEGIIYVVDASKHHVLLFDQTLTHIATLGSSTTGMGPGEFNYPLGVALDQNGNIYVADGFNFRVQIFDNDLNYITSLGSNGRGSASNQFSLPSKVTIDEAGNIYVCDGGNYDVRIFDSNYNFKSIIGNTGVRGEGNNEFTSPNAFALNSEGDLYIADTYNHRVQVFNNQQTYQSTLGIWSGGEGNNQFNTPYSCAVSSDGNVYVSDFHNQRIQIYDADFNYVSTMSAENIAAFEERFRSPYGIHIDTHGKLYVADIVNKRVQIYDQNHTYLATINAPDNYDTQKKSLYSPTTIATDNGGRIFIVDEYNHNILVYDNNYTHIYTLGMGASGNGDYMFSYPTDVAIDDQNNIYIVDKSNQRIQIYDNAFQYKSTIIDYSILGIITGIAIDKIGNIYVTDVYNQWVQVFDKDYHHIATLGIGKEGIEDGQFKKPFDVTLDSLGNIYVVDQDNNRIQRFDPITSYAVEVYPSQEGELSLSIPADIAEDAEEKGNEASSVLNLNYNAPPSVYMYVDNHSVSANGNYKLYINFSEQVSGFSSEDLIIENGNVSSLISGDDTTFVATIAPTGDETVTIDIPTDIATDVSGKGNKAAKAISFTVDSTRPVFQMSTDESNPTSNAPIVINGEFSEAAGMLSKSSFQLNNASIDSLSPGLPTYETTLGAKFEEIEDYLGSPVDIALDQNNHLYVASTKTNRIKIYDENLQYISSIGDGSIGGGNYQFKRVSGVAIDNLGMIYVTDAGNQRVQIYDADKQYVATLGSGQTGTGNNQFNGPGVVDIDNEGKVYVVDRYNHRVQVFDANLNYLATIGTSGISGSENNQLFYPMGVAVNSEGIIYIADARNQRIQVFDANFDYVATLGSGVYGSGNDQFYDPNGIAIDSKGSIYVADLGNRRIQKFDKNRNYVASIANHYDYRFPTMGFPLQLTVNNQDKLFVVDNRGVHVFDQNFVQLASLGTNGSGDGNDQFNGPQNLYIDHQQKLYIADRLNYRIQIFDADHNYLKTLQGDRTGKDKNTFMSCSGIAVDKLGNIYIGENFDRHHILIFDQDFKIVGRLGDGTMGTSNEQLSDPYSITFDREDNIYVVDRWNHRVQIFNHHHEYLATLGSGVAGSGNDQFENPADIAIDSAGNIYVVDPFNFRIQIFDHNRQYKATLGGMEANWEENLFLSLKAITIDKKGNVYVLDAHRIMVFDSELNLLYTLGSSGIGNNEFNNPSDIVVKDGKIYVADASNHRVQIFNASTAYQMSVSALEDGLVEINLPANVVSDQHGNGNEAAQFTITYDSTPPTVSLSSTVDSFTTAATIPVSIRFNEAVKDFDLHDLQITNATLGNLSTLDSTLFTADITAKQEGEVMIIIPEGVAKDLAEHPNKASNDLVFYYDAQPPRVEISSTEKDTTSLPQLSVKITFSEKVYGFSVSDVQLDNASIDKLVTDDSTSFTTLVSALNEGEIFLSIPAGVAKDRAGYENLVSSPWTIVYQMEDTVVEVPQPEVEKLTAFLSTVSDTVDGNFIVEIVFNRSVSDFSVSHVQVTNGHVVSFTTSDSIAFQLSVNPEIRGKIHIGLTESLASFNTIMVYYEQKAVTGIEEEKWRKEVKIYPVPADDEMTIEINLTQQTLVNVVLTASDGKIMYEKVIYGSGQLQEQINIEHLSPGVYIATISYNGQKVVRKIVKKELL